MAKHKFIKNCSAFVFALFILLLFGCNSASEKTQKSDSSSNAKDSSNLSSEPTQAFHLDGKFDTLYVEKAKFMALDKLKLVFNYVFIGGDVGDKLTMHGWSRKEPNNDFKGDPNLELLNANPTSLSYGPGTYFGNVTLEKKEVKDIQIELGGTVGYQYVGFAPVWDTLYHVPNHMRYQIFLSVARPVQKLVPGQFKLLTNTFANPSPPRTY